MSYQSQRPLSSVGTARVCLQDGGLPAPPIVVTTADGGIVSLHRDTMTQVSIQQHLYRDCDCVVTPEWPVPPCHCPLRSPADLARLSLHQMGMACAEPAPRPAGEPPLKLARSAAAADPGVRLTDVALTSAGHLAAAVDDRGQLYVYRITAAADPGQWQGAPEAQVSGRAHQRPRSVGGRIGVRYRRLGLDIRTDGVDSGH